jgi:hypothetical protein
MSRKFQKVSKDKRRHKNSNSRIFLKRSRKFYKMSEEFIMFENVLEGSKGLQKVVNVRK